MNEMTLDTFVSMCVEKQRAWCEAQLREIDDQIQATQAAWEAVLDEVRERLPEPLREVVELPEWVRESTREPGIDASVMVRLGAVPNLQVYAHPGEFRYPVDNYSRVPAFAVGHDLQWVTLEDDESGGVYYYHRWEEFDDLEMAVAAAYEELQRPLPEKPQADSEPQDERPGTFEICPLLMLANDADWDTVNNCGAALDQVEDAMMQWYGLRCIKEKCAWWTRSRCAIAMLAVEA